MAETVTITPGTRVINGRQVPEVGTWAIDPSHASFEFVARHLMAKVRGRFDVSGEAHPPRSPRSRRSRSRSTPPPSTPGMPTATPTCGPVISSGGGPQRSAFAAPRCAAARASSSGSRRPPHHPMDHPPRHR